MSTRDWRDADPLSNKGSLAAIRDFESVHQDNEGAAPDYYMSEELDHADIEEKLNRARERARERKRTEEEAPRTRVPFASGGQATDSPPSLFFGGGGSNSKDASESDSDDNDGKQKKSENIVQYELGEKKRYRNKLNITILHLDLGIGGAERLMVNVAISLLSLGHNVRIITSHHDPAHCFEETRPPSADGRGGGVLGDKIEVYGDWLPRQILGKATALCSVIRMVYLALVVLIMHYGSAIGRVFYSLPVPVRETGSKWEQYQRSSSILDMFPSHTDLVVVDGVSLPLPIFSWCNIPTIFYCHFPDKLLALNNSSHDSGIHADLDADTGGDSEVSIQAESTKPLTIVDKLRAKYRCVLDQLEELSTGCARCVMVNSQYTAGVFKGAFPVLGRDVDPLVVYPTLQAPSMRPHAYTDDSVHSDTSGEADLVRNSNDTTTLSYLQSAVNGGADGSASSTSEGRYLFVSLNRFERKKRVDLAINSFARMKRDLHTGENNVREDEVVLVVAGGYDSAVKENVEVLKQLKATAVSVGLIEGVDIHFRQSISSDERSSLLARANALLYTPTNEHFGIVPLEAMKAGCPVIAVGTGGPTETVIDGTTGFLVEQTSRAFCAAMLEILLGSCSPDTLASVAHVDNDQIHGNGDSSLNLKRSPRAIELGLNGVTHVSTNFHPRIMIHQFDMVLQVLVLDLISPGRKSKSTSTSLADGSGDHGVTRYIGTSGARIRTSSNDDAAANFVPFDDGITELTAPHQSRSKSPGVSLEMGGRMKGGADARTINGIEEGKDEDEMAEKRQVSAEAKAIASSFFSAAGHGLASPASAMNLFIPPYRPSPRNGGDSKSQNNPESGGNISPYNPTAIAKSLTTGVNLRHRMYAKTVRDVVLSWVTSAAIVVGVPLAVAIVAA